MLSYNNLLEPYNPWWKDPSWTDPKKLPTFRRPIFAHLLEDLDRLPQMISITGPRRVGKTTLLHQVIDALLKKGIEKDRLLYYSFDDPALITRRIKGGEVLDSLTKEFAKTAEKRISYFFLDEIQRLEGWELFLKKYYDLKYPIRWIISGSASSPIFKKSRESLLGRVKDHHLLPFSFREFFLFQIQDQPEMAREAETFLEQGRTVQGLLSGAPDCLDMETVRIGSPSSTLKRTIQNSLDRYFLEGGFPEVWSLPDWIAKQDYLYDNQVKKVIYEDLLLAAEFRKPELLKRFYISLLETPGREVSIQTASEETGIGGQQIEKYLPLLEMTDLVYRLEKFRKSPLRVRKGKMKFYLVDLALRNAVLRLTETLLQDDAVLGLYAENLVFLALKKWRGTIQMDYYREREGEVDFVVHAGPKTFVPIEVKYRNVIQSEDLKSIKLFSSRFSKNTTPIVVTKRWEDFGHREGTFFIPLPQFLLMFD